jgi:hypothetical protein
MIGLFSLTTFGALKDIIWGSKTARIVTISVAVVVGVWVYGKVQYWRGGIEKETRIVEESNKESRIKNKKSARIRRDSKPSTAKRRLQRYASPDSN